MCQILSGQNLENFAKGQMSCPDENCQLLQQGQMDIRTTFVNHFTVVVSLSSVGYCPSHYDLIIFVRLWIFEILDSLWYYPA